METKSDIVLDNIMVSASHAGKSKVIDAAHLSKVWWIYLKAAERTLEITSQGSKQTDDPNLSHNYGTNNGML